jgi:hypothetical protein
MIYFQPKIIKEETLNIIRKIESNNGKDTKHKSDAFGDYGIRINTAKELGYIITKKNERKVASAFYDEITKKLNTNNPEVVVYAWLKGIYGAKKQINKPLYYRPISSHWHVKKYRKYVSYYDNFITDINKILTNSQFTSKSI